MDHGVVPARKAKPRGTTAARVAGATPLDLPPREMNPLRPVPTPTTGAVSQRPPTELTLCQYTERQDAKKCNNLSKFECPYIGRETAYCVTVVSVSVAPMQNILNIWVSMKGNEGQEPPPRRWSMQTGYRSRSRQ